MGNCVKRYIPNLYGFPKALFYKNCKMSESEHKIVNMFNPFLYCEEVIDEYIKDKESLGNICMRLIGKFIEEKDIITQFINYKQRLVEREKGWDIKILDYIYENFQAIQLFYDVGHPTNFLLKEIANRIWAYLDIDETVSDNIKGSLICYEVPVHDCIKEVLGIQWSNGYLRERMEYTAHFVLTDIEMDWYECVKEYIWWHY